MFTEWNSLLNGTLFTHFYPKKNIKTVFVVFKLAEYGWPWHEITGMGKNKLKGKLKRNWVTFSKLSLFILIILTL